MDGRVANVLADVAVSAEDEEALNIGGGHRFVAQRYQDVSRAGLLNFVGVCVILLLHLCFVLGSRQNTQDWTSHTRDSLSQRSIGGDESKPQIDAIHRGPVQRQKGKRRSGLVLYSRRFMW